jgi:hypothetical protein
LKAFIKIVFLILVAFTTSAQNTDALQLVKEHSSISPGAHATLFFDLNSSLSSEAKHQLVLPLNWKILSEKIFERTEGKRYMFTISTPKETLSGEYPIRFSVRIGEEYLASNATLTVKEHFQLEMEPLDLKEWVKEGDTLITPFLIQNLGNTTEKVLLHSSKGEVLNSRDTLFLAPNSSSEILVRQYVPYSERSSWMVPADLTAEIEGRKPVYSVVSIPVYSNNSKKADPYLRLPIQAGLEYLNSTFGEQRFNSVQFNISGNGYLDFDRKHHVNFLFRGPNNIHLPQLGSYDQYSLSYENQKNKIEAGDYLLRFGQLLEFGRFGRGLKFEQRIGEDRWLAFIQNARFIKSQKESFGLGYTKVLKGGNELSLRYMSKNLVQGEKSFWSNLIGISGKFEYKGLESFTEASLGNANGKIDGAIYNRLSYSLGKLRLRNEFIQAGKNYYGYYTNSRFLLNSVNYQFNSQLSAGVNTNNSNINPSLDLNVFATSPLSKVKMAYLSYMPNQKNQFFFNLTQQEREDRQIPASYHFKESFWNLTYSHNSSRFTLTTSGRMGYVNNLLAEDFAERTASYNTSVAPEFGITSWFWLGGYFEYLHTSKFSQQNELQNLIYFGGNVRLNLNNIISLNGMYRNNYTPDQLYQSRRFTNGSLVFDFKKHQLSVLAGKTYIPVSFSESRFSTFFSMKYVFRIDAPVAKNKNIGHLKGRLIGLNDDLRQKGVLLQLGPYKVLSDGSGAFEFNNVLPEKYILSIPSTFELEGVKTVSNGPLLVDIKADTTMIFDVELVKTGSVKGEIAYRLQEKYNFDESEKGDDILILAKLSNGEEEFVTRVNRRNTFNFGEVKPGDWTLEVYMPGAQTEYEIPNNIVKIKVEPDKTETASFTLNMVQRKVRFTGQEFKLSSSKR